MKKKQTKKKKRSAIADPHLKNFPFFFLPAKLNPEVHDAWRIHLSLISSDVPPVDVTEHKQEYIVLRVTDRKRKREKKRKKKAAIRSPT